MATVYITTRSNYFRPKSIDGCMRFISTATDLTVWKKREDPTRIAFGGNSDIEVTEPYMETYLKDHPTECDDAMDIFIKGLQEFLPNDQLPATD